MCYRWKAGLDHDSSLGEIVADDRKWMPMKLTYIGDLQALVQGGGGKLSPETHDSGDIRKPPGQG